MKCRIHIHNSMDINTFCIQRFKWDIGVPLKISKHPACPENDRTVIKHIVIVPDTAACAFNNLFPKFNAGQTGNVFRIAFLELAYHISGKHPVIKLIDASGTCNGAIIQSHCQIQHCIFQISFIVSADHHSSNYFLQCQ